MLVRGPSPTEGTVMSLTLAAILAESAIRYPDRNAVVMGEQRISYQDLWEQSRRYATVLAEAGIGPGDRVALLMPNVPDFPRAYYAILSLGAVVVPGARSAGGPGDRIRAHRFTGQAADRRCAAAGAGHSGRRTGRGEAGRGDGWGRRRPAGSAGRRGRADQQLRGTPARGRGRHSLYVGDDRHPEGRRAHPAEHDDERDGVGQFGDAVATR